LVIFFKAPTSLTVYIHYFAYAMKTVVYIWFWMWATYKK